MLFAGFLTSQVVSRISSIKSTNSTPPAYQSMTQLITVKWRFKREWWDRAAPNLSMYVIYVVYIIYVIYVTYGIYLKYVIYVINMLHTVYMLYIHICWLHIYIYLQLFTDTIWKYWKQFEARMHSYTQSDLIFLACLKDCISCTATAKKWLCFNCLMKKLQTRNCSAIPSPTLFTSTICSGKSRLETCIYQTSTWCKLIVKRHPHSSLFWWITQLCTHRAAWPAWQNHGPAEPLTSREMDLFQRWIPPLKITVTAGT